MPGKPFPRTVAACAAVVAVGVLTGALTRGAVRAAPPAVDVENEWAKLRREHTDSVYDAATARFVGTLALSVTAARGAARPDSLVLVAVRGIDLRTCEDLGRQLRELARAVPAGPRWEFAIMVDPGGEPALRTFLARQRLGGSRVIVADPGLLLREGRSPATPAALIADRAGRIAAGISHPSRVTNVRERSFAQELGLIGPPRAVGPEAVGAHP
jgi:hypothetical protein